jgi:hypothetical protein
VASNGVLDEGVYMRQPPYSSTGKLHTMCANSIKHCIG